MCKALLEIAEVWGGGGCLTKNPFCGRGMDIFWSYAIFAYVLGQNDCQVKKRFLCLLTLPIHVSFNWG